MAFTTAIIVLQFLVGFALFLGHGLPKLKDVPATLSWFKRKGFGTIGGVWAIIVEGVASLLMAFAIFPRVMAALIAVTMFGAMVFHWKRKDPYKDGWEPSLLFFIAAVVIVLGGTSPWGLLLG